VFFIDSIPTGDFFSWLIKKILAAANEQRFRGMLRDCVQARKGPHPEGNEILIGRNFLEMLNENHDTKLNSNLIRAGDKRVHPSQAKCEGPK
jgi:hypothetical protein